MKRPGLLFAMCIVAIAAAALVVRMPRLNLRPMHCDEAVQAVNCGKLFDAEVRKDYGAYRYDPEEYHGPTLNWLTLPALWLGGTHSFAESSQSDYRIVPVVFGAGLVLLLLLVADGLGRPAAVIAAVLTAASPAMVFYSRYYIHEMLLVFFTFATLGCAWRYVRSGAIGWAIAAGASLGLMHATKETWVLAAAAMVAGLLGAVVWTRLCAALGGTGCLPASAVPTGRQAARATLRLAPILAAAAVACLVSVALYSSFFTYWRGPVNSILTYATYLHRGGGGEHAHPWYYYLQLLVYPCPMCGYFWTEGLIVALAVVGFIAAAGTQAPSEPQRAFGRFLAFYTLALVLIYAAIPYKTPWCMLSFFHGMILLAGIGAWTMLRWMPGWLPKVLLCLLLAPEVAHLGWQCYTLNFRFPADSRNPYVYAHTTTDTVKLAEQVERLADASVEGRDMVIHVVTDENCWPLPWYLRQFKHVAYPRTVEDWCYWQEVDEWCFRQAITGWLDDPAEYLPASVLIVAPDVYPQIEPHLRAAYKPQGMRSLRPQVFVMVLVREDLWSRWESAQRAP